MGFDIHAVAILGILHENHKNQKLPSNIMDSDLFLLILGGIELGTTRERLFTSLSTIKPKKSPKGGLS